MKIKAVRTGDRVRRIVKTTYVDKCISTRSLSRVVKSMFGLTNFRTTSIDTGDTFTVKLAGKNQTIQVFFI